MTSKESTVSTNQQTKNEHPSLMCPPAFSAELRQLLEKQGEPDLAAQMPGLLILDRCRCGYAICATRKNSQSTRYYEAGPDCSGTFTSPAVPTASAASLGSSIVRRDLVPLGRACVGPWRPLLFVVCQSLV